MFDHFDGVCCRSWNSAGKVTIRTPYIGRSINSGKIPKVPIFPDDEGSQKGKSRGATRAPDATPVWAHPGRAWVGSGGPGPPLTDLFRVYLLHGKPSSGGSSRELFRRLCGAETTKREKLSRRLQICRGNSLLEGETIAIITTIQLDFIGIIIIISTTRTIIITITISSCCNISGWILCSL